MAKGERPQKPSDVASLGATILVLLTGDEPFCEFDSALAIVNEITQGKRPTLPSSKPGEPLRFVLNFIDTMWQSDVNSRPLAKAVLAQFTLWNKSPPCADDSTMVIFSAIVEWVKLLDLPDEAAADVEKMLAKLGATKPSDLSELEDGEVAALFEFIPRLKKSNFKKQLEIYRPVLFFVCQATPESSFFFFTVYSK